MALDTKNDDSWMTWNEVFISMITATTIRKIVSFADCFFCEVHFFIYYVQGKWILQVKTNLQSIMKYPITLRICNTILRQYFRNLSLTTSNNLCKNLKYLFLKYMIHTSNACTEKVINLLLYSCFHETLKELA